MKKLVCFSICLMVLSACSFYQKQSYTFQVDTGDKIEVELKTNDGFSLLQTNTRFQVEKDNEQIFEAMFVKKELFMEQYNALLEDPGTTVLIEEKKDGNAYSFLECKEGADVEYYYIVWVKDTEVGVLLASTASKEIVIEAFDRLTIGLDF